MCGQHPGRMSRVGGVMFMSLVFYMFQSILSIFGFVEKINHFHGRGVPPPFAENSAKIINLIFEPFPYLNIFDKYIPVQSGNRILAGKPLVSLVWCQFLPNFC